MLRKNASALKFWTLVLFFAITVTSVKAATQEKPLFSDTAEFFGLPFNNLHLSKIQEKLKNIGLHSYPSYKNGVVSYSLGEKGILGVTNATIHSNPSSYVTKALLSGVVQSKEDRQALGEVFVTKYGKPTVGFISEGIGRGKWFFEEGTMIELKNSTFDVSISYVDEQPKEVSSRSGKIDVEALSRKN